jgi:hypothetical protein
VNQHIFSYISLDSIGSCMYLPRYLLEGSAMKPVFRYTFVGFALLLLLGVPLFITAPRAKGQSTTSNWVNPFQKIEQNARSEDPNNSDSVRALVDAVFDYPRSFGQVPADVLESVKVKLTQSEIAYLKANRLGIRLLDVVKLFNEVAAKLNLPDFATTSPRQMRHLRMQIMLDMPTFMGKGAIRQGMINGESISGIMSPVQATHLFLEMAEVKVLDPDYQFAPVDWEKHQNQVETEKWQMAKARRALGEAPPSTNPSAVLGSFDGSKTLQFANAVGNGWSALSADDTSKIVAGCLKTLGIQ